MDARHTDMDGALGDHGTVGFVDDSVDLLEVIRVGDDLVAGEDVLFGRGGSVSRPGGWGKIERAAG